MWAVCIGIDQSFLSKWMGCEKSVNQIFQCYNLDKTTPHHTSKQSHHRTCGYDTVTTYNRGQGLETSWYSEPIGFITVSLPVSAAGWGVQAQIWLLFSVDIDQVSYLLMQCRVYSNSALLVETRNHWKTRWPSRLAWLNTCRLDTTCCMHNSQRNPTLQLPHGFSNSKYHKCPVVSWKQTNWQMMECGSACIHTQLWVDLRDRAAFPNNGTFGKLLWDQ